MTPPTRHPVSQVHYHIDIERVILHGADPAGMTATDLGALIESAVSRRLMTAPLPNGRTMKTAVGVATGALRPGPPGAATAVAAGVAGALDGGRAHG